MLVVGGEAEGAGAETLQRVDEKLSIPMPGEIQIAECRGGSQYFDV